MARLIVKSPYIKCGGGGRGAGGYLRYIGTRERVELLPDGRPPTQKQERLVLNLMRDFPDVESLGEYKDYAADRTRANASALISAALENHWEDAQRSEVYMKYIATRPRAERLGAHGLFGDEDHVDLPAAMEELEHYTGNVWTHIISLTREDVLPSERSKAYKMRLEAIKRTAGRPRKEISDKEVAHEIENESLLLLRRRATVRQQLHALARTDVAEVAARVATTSALDVRALDDQPCHSSPPAMPRACCSNEMRPLVSFTFRTLSRRSACRAASLHS